MRRVTRPETWQQLLTLAPQWWLLALLPISICLCLHALGWSILLRALGVSLTWPDMFKIYFYSNLTRYLPGTFWYAASRTVLCQQKGGDVRLTAVSLGLEMLVAILSGITIFAAGALCKLWGLYGLLWTLGIGMAVGGGIKYFGTTYPPLMAEKITQWLPAKLVPYWQSLCRLNPLRLLEASVIFAGAWLIQGCSLFLLLNAWQPLPWTVIFYTTISYAAGWVLGVLTPFAPNGAGIREGILVLGLRSFASPPIILSASVALRLFTFIAEIGLALLFWMWELKNTPAA